MARRSLAAAERDAEDLGLPKDIEATRCAALALSNARTRDAYVGALRDLADCARRLQFASLETLAEIARREAR
jgi:hypothetical protein